MIFQYGNSTPDERIVKDIMKKAYIKLNKEYAYQLKRFERNVRKCRFANSKCEKERYFDKLQEIKNTLLIYLHNGADPNTCITPGFTGLHFFASIADLELVRKALEKGANPNAIAPSNWNTTPLHMASGMKLFICRDIEKLTQESYRELNRTYAQVIRLLINNGANPDIGDKSKSTPLHYASFYGNLEVTKALIEGDANTELTDKNGSTPLIVSYLKDMSQVMKYLLFKGADPDNRGGFVVSPAESAVARRRFADLEHMLLAGANGSWNELKVYTEDDEIEQMREFYEEKREKIRNVFESIKDGNLEDKKMDRSFKERFDDCAYPAYYALSLEEFGLFDKIIDKYCADDREKRILVSNIFDYDRQKADGLITWWGYDHVLKGFPELRKEFKPVGHSIELGRKMECIVPEDKKVLKKMNIDMIM